MSRRLSDAQYHLLLRPCRFEECLWCWRVCCEATRCFQIFTSFHQSCLHNQCPKVLSDAAIPGLARMCGHTPFPLQQSLPLQHARWCKACSLSDRRHMSRLDMAMPRLSRLDLTQQGSLQLCRRRRHHATQPTREATVGQRALKPQAYAPTYALSLSPPNACGCVSGCVYVCMCVYVCVCTLAPHDIVIVLNGLKRCFWSAVPPPCPVSLTLHLFLSWF